MGVLRGGRDWRRRGSRVLQPMECRRRGARDRPRTAQPHCRRDRGRPAGGG
ncbi:hypothetical protein chiPu_0022823, partial [Chiloscyllium punctatum]|nr:hypothetical protein [Chiloscyllium punctatum]